MDSFYEKNDFTIDDIKQLIKDSAEESLTLEFKAAPAIRNKKEIAKDVSAFANSAGGIIIYGLKEENHVATQLSFIDGNVITKEQLEQVINSNIQKRIKGLRIIPVRNEKRIEESIYIVKIPESNTSPHMIGNKYYKRFNFQSIAMEEYEVRSNYYKSRTPQLEVKYPRIYRVEKEGLITLWGYDGNMYGDFRLLINIENVGNVGAKESKMEVFISTQFVNFPDLGKNDSIRRFETDSLNEYGGKKFSIPIKNTIFPKEKYKVGTLDIKIEPFINDLQRHDLVQRVFHEGGYDEKKISIIDMFNFQKENWRKR